MPLTVYQIEYQTHSAQAKKMDLNKLRVKATTLRLRRAELRNPSPCFLARHDAYLDELTRRDTTEPVYE